MRSPCRPHEYAVSVRRSTVVCLPSAIRSAARYNFAAHYDLLASESRLDSLVAIAKGDVPAEHWLALGRPYTSENGQVLISWSGTMFEYLMPRPVHAQFPQLPAGERLRRAR